MGLGDHAARLAAAFGAAKPSPFALRAAGFMLVAAVSAAGMNACARFLSGELHPFEIGFFRCLFGLLVLLPPLLHYGFVPLRTSQIRLHVIRAMLNVTATLLFFIGLAHTPLAKASALDFSAPLFAAVLAVVFLHERMPLRRLAALLAGAAGVLIVLRPGLGKIDLGALFVLASGATWGLTLIIIKVLSRSDSSLTTTIYVGLFTTPLALLAALPVWQTPSLGQLGWLAVTGGLGGLGQLCLAQALRTTDVTLIMPIDFTKLIWASLLGFLVFAELPDIWTWIGGTIIFAAAFYVAATERAIATVRI
jgi:drug/metabolite transporter (DMT)-like permease